eukprot:4787783-Heterocapsa_arctica.AAC.1
MVPQLLVCSEPVDLLDLLAHLLEHCRRPSFEELRGVSRVVREEEFQHLLDLMKAKKFISLGTMSDVVHNEQEDDEGPEPKIFQSTFEVVGTAMAPVPPLEDVEAQAIVRTVHGRDTIWALVLARREARPSSPVLGRPLATWGHT